MAFDKTFDLILISNSHGFLQDAIRRRFFCRDGV